MKFLHERDRPWSINFVVVIEHPRSQYNHPYQAVFKLFPPVELSFPNPLQGEAGLPR